MLRGMWTILQVLLLALWASGETVEITGLGKVNGTTTTSAGGSTIYSFYAIPYAMPLTGDIRFKKPVPYPRWEETLDCTEIGPACPQPEKFISYFSPKGEDGIKETSIDCLHLDVHTRSIKPEKKKLPVLVFFHGGAFTVGNSGSIEPTYFLDHEMVLVVPQFRLGVLGLLSLGTDSIPGNAALFDQILALKWVQENIANFNGDPDKVTIAGQSTGAAFATLHMFSPESTGLFSQVIAHGGTGIASWAITEDPETAARYIAAQLNCNNPEISELEKCIDDRTTQEIVDKYVAEDLMRPLIPAVQKDKSDAFINKHPFDILQSQKYNSVPILAGFNKHEGMLFTEFIHLALTSNQKINDKDFLKNELVRAISEIYDVPDTSGVLVDSLTKRYFNESELGDFNAMYNGLVDLCGTAFAKGNVYRLVQFNSELNDSYLYAFNYYSSNHVMDHIDDKPDGDGVLHGDELMYLFPQKDMTMNEDETKTSKMLVEIWANFIINGNPAPPKEFADGETWKPFKKEDDRYLVIDNDGMKVVQGFRQQLTIARDNGLEFGHSDASLSSGISLLVFCIASFVLFLR